MLSNLQVHQAHEIIEWSKVSLNYISNLIHKQVGGNWDALSKKKKFEHASVISETAKDIMRLAFLLEEDAKNTEGKHEHDVSQSDIQNRTECGG